MTRRILLALFAAALCAPLGAQTRSIPAAARAGVLRHISGLDVHLDGRRARLAPGAQIRDASNRVLLPGSLTEPVLVLFTLDALGQIHLAWIPTAEERARFPQPSPPGSLPY